ncbi:MAG TPA: hypothetical protein VHE55_13985 [Fimbriimonadaceae bacterium]|nr:hypothetical protein [Fimbriimonadaceae bacterium]
MKSKHYIAIGISLLVLVGCQSASVPPGSGQSQPPPVVPDSLKNDAYHWYGLANDKPMKIKMTSSAGKSFTGTQTFKLVSVADGKAIFEIDRDGDLGDTLGNETLSLEPDGVYTIKSTQIEGDIHNLELPAVLKPGTTFKNKGKDMKMRSKSGSTEDVGQDENFKVVGPSKVTTEAGTQDALLVTSTGSMSMGGTTYRIDASIWYVKDKGIVKSVFDMKDVKDPKAPKQEITIQETK